jgi:hypothetical protein
MKPIENEICSMANADVELESSASTLLITTLLPGLAVWEIKLELKNCMC